MSACEIVTIRHACDKCPRHSEASLCERLDGSLYIAWQEFTDVSKPGHDDSRNRIVTQISGDGGRSWGGYQVLVEPDDEQTNVYSPSIVATPSGEWILTYFAKYGRMSTSGYLRRSTDEGITWSAPEPIWDKQPLASANHVIRRLSSGRLVYPIWCQQGVLWTPTDHCVAGCMWSDDGGRSWTLSNSWVDLPRRGAMEPHVEELTDGRLMMVVRTQLGSLYEAFSEDQGQSWSNARRMSLQAPESSPELIKAPRAAGLLLVWNNSRYDAAFGTHYGRRSPLSLTCSCDSGKTWSTPLDIESDPQRGYTNSASIFLSDGKLVVTYFTAPYMPSGEMDTGRSDLRCAIMEQSSLGQLGIDSAAALSRGKCATSKNMHGLAARA